MSFVASVDRDARLLQVLTGIVIAALVGTVTVVLLGNHERGGSLSATQGVTSPSIKQAPWKTRVFPAGVFGGIDKKDLKVVRAQAKPVSETVERSLDALVLDQGSAKGVLQKTFSAPAADQMLKSDFGAPDGASQLKTTLRAARVGVQARGARAAAAKVRVAYQAMVKGHSVHVAEAATLWLERSHHAWHVVGFDVDQGPAPHRSHHASSKGSSAGKKKHGHGGHR